MLIPFECGIYLFICVLSTTFSEKRYVKRVIVTDGYNLAL